MIGDKFGGRMPLACKFRTCAPPWTHSRVSL